MEPRLRYGPVALDGRGRDSERDGGVLNRHPSEETAFHDLRLTLGMLMQLFQRAVEGENGVRGRRRETCFRLQRPLDFLERGWCLPTSSLCRRVSACMADENLAHGGR